VALVPGNRLPGSLVADFVMRENLTFASLETVTGALGAVRRPHEQPPHDRGSSGSTSSPRTLSSVLAS
jgi:hypothetical protein